MTLTFHPPFQGETDCDLDSRPSNVLNLMKEWKDELRNESLSMTELCNVDGDDDDDDVHADDDDADDDDALQTDASKKDGDENQLQDNGSLIIFLANENHLNN